MTTTDKAAAMSLFSVTERERTLIDDGLAALFATRSEASDAEIMALRQKLAVFAAEDPWRSIDIDNLSAINLRTWLEFEAVKLGTENQRERFRTEGRLPDDEITAIARAELFKPFMQFTKWSPIKWSEVKHKGGPDGRVDVSTALLSAGSVEHYGSRHPDASLRPLLAVAMATIDHPWLKAQQAQPHITVRNHVARCAYCRASVERTSALVAIPWAGRQLSREFAL